MKLQKLTIILFALFLTALANGAALAQSETGAAPERKLSASPFPFLDRRPLPTGAWEALGNTAIQGNFKALLTFTADGVVLADEPGGAFETTGHGNWIRLGANSFGYTFIAYIGSANAGLVATIKVSGSLSLGDEIKTWEGPFKLTVTATNGTVIFQDQGTFKAARIAVEPVN